MPANTIGFALKGITTEQFALLDDNYTEGADVNFEVALNFGFDAKAQMVAAFVKCSYLQNSRRFIIIEAACHFEIQKEDWDKMWNKEEGKLTLPKNFATHLAMLATGTARGILHAKTENTVFQKFFLPPIDITAIITEDVVLQNQP